MNNRNIYISGVNGFIGKYLSNYLKNESVVLPISRDYLSSIREKEFQYSSLSPIPFVYIHLAGKAHDLKKTSEPNEYYTANTELTKSIFNDFLKSDAEVFIMLSSVKAVADSVKGILSENLIPEPKTHYGKSKLLAEQYILSKKIPTNKRVYILRPCMVHGKGNKGNLNLLYKIVKKGIPYPLANFYNERSFLSIDNLCFIIRELIFRKDIASGIYNVSDDAPISTNRLIQIMGEAMSKKVKLWKINNNIINYLAKFGDMTKLPLNTERLIKLTENYVVSNQKIKLALGKNLPVSSEDGLRKTIESFNT